MSEIESVTVKKVNILKIQEMIDDNASIEEIALFFNVTKTAIRKQLKSLVNDAELKNLSLKEQIIKVNLITPDNVTNKKVAYLLEKYPNIKAAIDDYCNDAAASYPEKLYRILHDLHDKPICLCGELLRWIDTKRMYSEFCGRQCIHHKKTTRTRYEEAMIEKYGYAYPLQSPMIKQKFDETFQLKYNTNCPSKLVDYDKKTKDTKYKKYGDQTFTNRSKALATNIERYSRENPVQNHFSDNDYHNINNASYLQHMHHDEHNSISSLAKQLNISKSALSKKFTKFDIDKKIYGSNAIAQQEIVDFIKNVCDLEIGTNNRQIISPNELDIVLPSKRLAIEYDGIYWHGEHHGDKGRKYHLNKTIACQNNGYNLIHIFETEWKYKKSIVESKIKNLLGFSNKIYGRKTQIYIPSKDEVKTFMDVNHLQGYTTFHVAIALKYNDSIVSMITLGKSRFNKHYQWELLRFCNTLDTTVHGGLSKMLRYFESVHKPASLVSYCDKRWSVGNSYKKIGMELIGESSPNYFYFSINEGSVRKIYSRQQFQKHKLKNKLKIFDPQLTEWENMKVNGWDRIWDCGNFVFVKIY